MFDLDGTLILSDRKLGGYTAIPGAAEALARARRARHPVDRDDQRQRLSGRGPGPAAARGRPADAATSGCSRPTAWRARRWSSAATARVLVLGTQGVVDALEEMGVPCVLPEDEAAHRADAVYVAWHPECTMPHIHLACERVLDGAAFLTASDVPFFATKDGRSFGYSCAINGAVARVTGASPNRAASPARWRWR